MQRAARIVCGIAALVLISCGGSKDVTIEGKKNPTVQEQQYDQENRELQTEALRNLRETPRGQQQQPGNQRR